MSSPGQAAHCAIRRDRVGQNQHGLSLTVGRQLVECAEYSLDVGLTRSHADAHRSLFLPHPFALEAHYTVPTQARLFLLVRNSSLAVATHCTLICK